MKYSPLFPESGRGPPQYEAPLTSLSRSRTSPEQIRSIAEAMLQASISRDSSSPSSTVTRSSYAGTPLSLTADRFPPLAPPTQPQPGDRRAAPASPRTPRSPPDTTSRTRERLRALESQLEAERARASQMRELAEKERGLAERLKREAAPALSTAEKERRVRKIKHDMRATSEETIRRPTKGLFKSLYSVDLLFLIDTTGSMGRHIEAAKNQVKTIINDIKVTFFNEAEVRMAVVGYKDHYDRDAIQFLDFTTSVDVVRAFLDAFTATGGGDEPEDVLGGLKQAINASWKHQTRCIIHIADAPPHGRTLHNLPDHHDVYSEPGSEPHGLTHPHLVQQMLAIKLNYALLRINNSTDRMAFTIWKSYFAAGGSSCKLHKTNRYYKEDADPAVTAPETALLFEEAELGTEFSKLRHLVVKVVTSSASLTASRELLSPRRSDWSMTSSLASISEDDVVSLGRNDLASTVKAGSKDKAPVDDGVQLEIGEPKWGTAGWLDKKLVVEGFSPDVLVHRAHTLDGMMASDDNIKMSVTQLAIRMRSSPFAKGAMRMAFYASTALSTNRYVVKAPKPHRRSGKKLAHVAEEMQCQALCKAFALEFNALLSKGKHSKTHSLDFIVTTCLDAKSGGETSIGGLVSLQASDGECLSLEPYIPGDYVKYNTNSGHVNNNFEDPINVAAQAFSHFTFERSRGKLLVSDLQGVGNMLTDPAVHTLDAERFKLNDTNLNGEGFKCFFATHDCNEICRELRLKSDRSMIASGPSSYKFRETWPKMAVTACCSNKLCGRIVRLDVGGKSDKFPGYIWCSVCFWQLRITERAMCIHLGPGPDHEFDVSRFFYESQGLRAPRKCPKHREGDAIPRGPVADPTIIPARTLRIV